MSAPRYLWRQLNEKQRAELLLWRRARGYPWHSPPHHPNFGHLRFLISASCFEHRYYIGHTTQRMDNFFARSGGCVRGAREQTFAWCVLPNHYHALVEAPDVKALLHELGTLHGRTAHAWNGEDWPWSSATEYLAETGVEEAKRIWQAYPLRDYRKDWDEPAT